MHSLHYAIANMNVYRCGQNRCNQNELFATSVEKSYVSSMDQMRNWDKGGRQVKKSLETRQKTPAWLVVLQASATGPHLPRLHYQLLVNITLANWITHVTGSNGNY